MKATVIAVIAMVLMAFCVMPVAASNADNNLYTSKYAATGIDYPTTGALTGAVRCHNNLLTVGVTITGPGNVATPVELRADGTFDVNDLSPGEYVMNIADGNGGQPESAKFTIRAGYTSFLESELLGHAASPTDAATQLDIITVLNATYGMQHVVVDSPAVPAIPGIPAVTHQVAMHHGAYDVHGHFVGLGNGDYQKKVVYWHVTYVYVAPTIVTVIDVPAVPGTPAVPAVTHIEGSFADVTAQVQEAINRGARTFVFNNAMVPGGIVNADQTAVIVAIEDPAVGQVKSVIINVEINGALKTVNTMEYETITI
jgi:hypothetical protein